MAGLLRRAPRYAFFALWLGLVLSIAVAFRVRQHVEDEAITEVAFAADQITTRIEERLAAFSLILRGGSALFETSERVTREDWSHFTRALRASDVVVGVQGIGFARLIKPSELAASVSALRAEGFHDYRVWPPGEREVYSAIEFLEPFSGRNLRAFGYDMLSESVRREAMEKARDTGRAALSGRVELVQETDEDKQAGTLMYVPVYRAGANPQSVAERRAELLGWVYSPYRMKDLMNGILGQWETEAKSRLTLAIYDGEGAVHDSLLHADPPTAVGLEETWRRQLRTISFNGSTWTLHFDHLAPSTGVYYGSVWLTLVGGCSISLLLFALLTALATTRDRASRMANELTATIRLQETELRGLLARLQTIADRVPGTVYEYRRFADGSSCFPYASKGIEQVYRVTPEQAMEDAKAVFDAIHPEDLDALVASIEYSQRHLTPWQHEYRVLFPDGSLRWLFGDSVPHANSDDSVTWYGVITDITDRKLGELALQAANLEAERFRTAMDYMSSCVYMKDRDCRYTYANRAALEVLDVAAIDLPGSSDSDFFPPATVRRMQQTDLQALAGEQSAEELDLFLSDAGQRYFLEVKAPIYKHGNSGEISGILAISTDITAIKRHEEQLDHIAHYDALTGLPNRLLLADRLQQAMAQAQRRKRHLAVIFLDLDNFKAINDRYGHSAGDQLLVAIASRIRAILREGDTLSRLGGDEFVAVLPDLDGIESSTLLLSRILEAAAQPLLVDDHTLEVSGSIGITFYPQSEPVEADQLLRQADQAMYQAKLAGRGRYHVFDADMDRNLRVQHERTESICRAFDNREFTLFYQPKVNMQTGEVLGAEGLLRWRHPERGILAPAQFLPLIEDHPMMLDIGRWVLRTALDQIAQWQAQGHRMVVSINVSSLELRQPDFVLQLQEALAEFPTVPPQQLELEVLETSALGDLHMVSRLLAGCRDLGVGVSLDDFGTGYSSLTYLKQLPAGIIKIDQSFVRDIIDDPQDLAILSGILGISAAFGRSVLAEGVETVEHGMILLRMGCRLAQGYGIAAPMPAEDFVRWSKSWSLPADWTGVRRLSQESMPLLYAIVEHRRWVQEIVACVNNRSHPRPDPVRHHCQFSQWVEEHRFTAVRFQIKIKQLHREIHEQAEAVLAKVECGDQSAALAGLPQLHRIRDELTLALQRYIAVLAG